MVAIIIVLLQIKISPLLGFWLISSPVDLSEMDGERRKKRKLDVALAEEEEEKESEEVKMEKFFALIRSSKDIWARLMINGQRMKEEEKKKPNERKPVGVWTPTFQPEDFMEDGLNVILCPSGRNNEAGPSNFKIQDDHEREEDDGKGEGDVLDLKLSL